jgi:hypothetical protein
MSYFNRWRKCTLDRIFKIPGLIRIIFDAGDDNGHMLSDFWFLENWFNYGHKGVNKFYTFFPNLNSFLNRRLQSVTG